MTEPVSHADVVRLAIAWREQWKTGSGNAAAVQLADAVSRLPEVADAYCALCDHDSHECSGCGWPTTHAEGSCCAGCAGDPEPCVEDRLREAGDAVCDAIDMDKEGNYGEVSYRTDDAVTAWRKLSEDTSRETS